MSNINSFCDASHIKKEGSDAPFPAVSNFILLTLLCSPQATVAACMTVSLFLF